MGLRRFNVIALFELDHPGISLIDGQVQAIRTQGLLSLQRLAAERIRTGDGVRLNVPVFDLVITVRNRIGIGVLRFGGKEPLDKRVNSLDGQARYIECGMQTDSESIVMMQCPAFVDLHHRTISDVWNLLFDPLASR